MANDHENSPHDDGTDLPWWWPGAQGLGLALIDGVVYLYVLARPPKCSASAKPRSSSARPTELPRRCYSRCVPRRRIAAKSIKVGKP
jgi:hypothetical protein